VLHKEGVGDVLRIHRLDLASKMITKTGLLIDFLAILASKNDGKTKLTYKLVGDELEIELSGFRNFQHNFGSKCGSKLLPNADQKIPKSAPRREEKRREDVRAPAPDNNIGLSTDPKNPDPLDPSTKQPIPWDPFTPMEGQHPRTFLRGYWSRRAIRAIKDRIALKAPLSFEERAELEAKAKQWDEDFCFQMGQPV
jgi:hypothetical protein